ncbi:MAG: EamA family transporter [Clostridia bacterium]|nr:EamA family transporter [Clostridia bacterium]
MRPKAALIASMVIFGTIGVFRRYIPLPSSLIAALRGLIGMLFLLGLMAVRGERLSMQAIRRHAPVLFLSSVAMGFNWILLFEAYRYTSVAAATLCYYMAPMLVILASPVLLGERISRRKLICVAAALVGMVLVSGVLRVGVTGRSELRGILFGLGAAVLYASVILLNKRLGEVAAFDRTVVQLGMAAVVLLPYSLLTETIALAPGVGGGFLLVAAMMLLVGVVHTGVAYAMYFGSIKALPAQTVALMSYIDPIVAILLGALLLGEAMGMQEAIGAALVLGAAVVSELPEKGR